MWNWIKKYFDYRSKYHALLNERNEAIKQAIDVMARYDFLCASLPKGHELSTERNWQAFANNRLRSENFNLTKKLEAITEAHNSMTYLWQDNLYKYGVEMYGKWQPMDVAPSERVVLAAYQMPDNTWYINIALHTDGQWSDYPPTTLYDGSPKFWMPLPAAPDPEKKS